MTEHDLRLIEIGEKAGAEKATKQIVAYLKRLCGAALECDRTTYARAIHDGIDAIEAGEPFQ